MRAAPGARLEIADIFGRDRLIQGLWRVLETTSVRMEAERRIGKTSILRKMAAESPTDWEAVQIDLEKVHSAEEFAQEVSERVHDRLTGWKRTGRRLADFLGWFKGTHVGPLKFPDKKDRPEGYWKKLLERAIEDLVEQQAAVKKRVVFFFDEMPWMLDAIADAGREGPQTAMEVLDVLRALRQSQTVGSGFRMILCGSVGLHHVLGKLQKHGYKNRPVNDMRLVEIPALDQASGADLAGRLLQGEGIAADPGAAALISELTGGFAFYIHWVVSELRMSGEPATVHGIEQVVVKLLTDAHDPCDLHHFRERLGTYYGDEAKHALGILDYAAQRNDPASLADLANAAKTVGAMDEERARELVRLLSLDHYLASDAGNRYAFRHAVLRRWWRLSRGIA